MLPGDRRAAGVGLGTELAQLRPYEIGDDVRHIDPAATARTGQPHVRLHVPERALTTWIVLDVSPSMAFGTARRLKADVAEGVALVFGRLGVRRAGSVGLVAFGAGAPRVLPPRGSKPGIVAVRRMLGRGRRARRRARCRGAWRARCARRAAGAPARARGRDLRFPRPARLGAPARVAAHAPLGARRRDRRSARGRAARRRTPRARRSRERRARRGQHLQPRGVRERFAELERERRETVARELRRLRIDHVTLSTDDDWLLALGRQLRMSFASPLWLAALALVPIARRRCGRCPRGARGATRSGSRRCRRCELAAGARSSWRRHVPAALALAAIAALALALARPHVSYGAPINAGVDHARHRPLGLDGRRPMSSRRGWRAAERAANTFIDKLPAAVRLGAIAFSTSPDAVQAPVTNHSAARGDHRRAGGRRLDSDRERPRARAPAPARRGREASALGDRPALRRRRQHRSRTSSTVAREAAARQDPDLHHRARHAGRRLCSPTRSPRRCPCRPIRS